jgi:hypothetical protein
MAMSDTFPHPGAPRADCVAGTRAVGCVTVVDGDGTRSRRMQICPVALVPCERPACHGGHCFRAGARALFICWQCGSLEHEGVVHGLCVACVQVHPAHDTQPTE